MATTVGNFTAIDDTEVDAESPITESLMTRLRDNAYWVNEGTTQTTSTDDTTYLRPDGSGGVEWADTSDIANSPSYTGAGIATSSGSPTQISVDTSRVLVCDIFLRPSPGASYKLIIDGTDDSYIFLGGTQVSSSSGTLTGSFVNLLVSGDVGADSGSFGVRVTGGNYELYETLDQTGGSDPFGMVIVYAYY